MGGACGAGCSEGLGLPNPRKPMSRARRAVGVFAISWRSNGVDLRVVEVYMGRHGEGAAVWECWAQGNMSADRACGVWADVLLS